tara:strand:- start:406 stop:960 length:555 start_codon:yes stop_codon:yes gene_type:complete
MKRETAFKVRIQDILKNEYVVREGWEPNYLVVGENKVARVNVIGTVTGKEQDLFLLDDGSGTIPLRSFEEPLVLSIGEVYLIIGRPRVYNDQRYLVPEITKKVQDKTWISIRQKELQDETSTEVKESSSEDKPNVLDLIEKLDEGEGVSIALLEEKAGKCDTSIKHLLEEGEVFEIKPGILKAL